ncbi:MAG: helix-turn-helix transcriptional regulator [Oscillospiraceae bacterium]|nr:helix-turn-helix transcriptional regulator [Oscillospiraceae bacterium]
MDFRWETVHERIKEARKLSGKSVPEFAGDLYCATSTYYKYENAQARPSVDKIAEIAALTGVSTDWLLGLSQERNIQHSIIDEIGLSQEAIDALRVLHQYPCAEKLYGALDCILANKHFLTIFLLRISRYIEAVVSNANSNFYTLPSETREALSKVIDESFALYGAQPPCRWDFSFLNLQDERAEAKEEVDAFLEHLGMRIYSDAGISLDLPYNDSPLLTSIVLTSKTKQIFGVKENGNP